MCTPEQLGKITGHTRHQQRQITVDTPRQQEQTTVYTPRQQEQTTVYTPRQQEQTTVYTPRQQEQTTVYSPRQQEQTTVYTPRQQKQTTEYTPTQPRTGGPVTDLTTTHHHTTGQPTVSVTTQDVLGCLQAAHSSLTLEAEEVWLSLDYTGNMSGSPHLHAPSTCWLQVRGLGPRVMSMLIFNVTCFTDNQLVVHSSMRRRHSYDCDPTAWVAPGVELVMTSKVANVSIDISDVDTPFSLQALFKTIPDSEGPFLEIRMVNQNLGNSVFCYLIEADLTVTG